MSSSRIHHTEVSPRELMGIRLGWASLALLIISLLGLAGNTVMATWTWVTLVVGLVLGLAYLVIRKDAAIAAVTSPNAAYRANTGVLIVAVFGILVLANYIAGRHYKQIDLTKQQLNTLSPQSVTVVKNLKEDVNLTAFYPSAGRGAQDAARARDLLRQYKELSPKVKVEFIDPVADPAKAMAKAGSSPSSPTGASSVPYNVIWCESGGRKEQVYNVGEQDVTSGILKVSQTTKKKIYFLFGHGENDIDGTGANSMGAIKRYLEKVNYDVSKLVLMTTKTVPSDAALVVIAGPQQPIPANEQKALGDYLNANGKMLVLLNSNSPVPTDLIKPYGIEVGSTMVKDPANPQFAVVQQFETHPITKDCQLVVMPLAVSVTAAATPPTGVTDTAVLKAQDQTAGQVSVGVVATKGGTPPPQPGMPPMPDQNKDQKSTRMVVLGSAMFATDQAATAYHNPRLIMNTLNWLAQEDSLISIPPKDPENNQITMLPTQANWVLLITVVIIPFGVLLTGVGIWWRRR